MAQGRTNTDTKTAFAIGVDMGGTNLRVAVVDSTGSVLDRIATGTAVASGPDSVVDDICAAVRELSGRSASAGRLLGIGIGVPGIIDRQRGMLRASPNLPGWIDYPMQRELESRLGARVVLENDANAAALGEKWLGAARHADDMCMITLGTGIGGGIVVHGEIWHGMTGMAGEIGHVTVDPGGQLCGCGNRGCVEQYASATALQRMASEALAAGQAPRLSRAMKEDPSFGPQTIYELAMQGDGPARRIFERAGSALGVLLAGLINIFNLPIYVIGGGVSNAWDAFAPSMFEEVRRRSYVYQATAPSVPGTEAARDPAPHSGCTIITRAQLGSDAGLIGAARLAMLENERYGDHSRR